MADPSQKALLQAEARYRTLVEQIPAIVYTAEYGEEGRWSYVSPQIERLLGFRVEEWLARPSLWFDRLHPEDRERALRDEQRSRVTGTLSSEYRMIGRDGNVVWFRDEAKIVSVEGQSPFMHGVMYDVTDRKDAEAELAYLAYHDKLTGLPNRQLFAELLDLAVARASRQKLAVAVEYIDLDAFKVVNDTLGHAAGDKLLQQASMRLREVIRDVDAVARHGGDEFLLLLGDLPRAPKSPADAPQMVAERVATRVIECFSDAFFIAGEEAFVTPSIGIAIFPDGSDSPEALLKHADAAMYESKRSGPGQFVVHSQTTPQPSRLSLTTRLRHAVQAQEWVLHYQPIIDLRTGAMTAAEALIRWQSPQGGLIGPGEFVPLAEELGLITAIGEWVLGEVLEQCRIWQDAGLDLRVSLNLSPRQLHQRDLVERVTTELREHHLDPSMLILEITESAAMVDPERTQRVFQELRTLGVGLALDDFGTGYSSLSRLRYLPVDILKIDRSFIADVARDPHTRAMVAAFVQLAHNLDVAPLAEGIETEEELEFVKSCDCTLAQGFLFSRPVEAHELPAPFAIA
ncbi:MAG TPA: EAL domain-containing protein [Actinomycetota bacterium]|jgi:diguanylate cyclase (GGDEF)-like protein/PAS domain S-box-containing protein